MNLKCQSIYLLLLQKNNSLQYRSKVSWHSKLDPRDSILETFEDRVSRIEKQGFLEYAKTRKGFEETIYFSKEE